MIKRTLPELPVSAVLPALGVLFLLTVLGVFGLSFVRAARRA